LSFAKSFDTKQKSDLFFTKNDNLFASLKKPEFLALAFSMN